MILPMPQGWVIERGDYTGQVTDGIARMRGELIIRLLRDGAVEVPLQFQGPVITSVELDRGSRAALIPREQGYVLSASKKGTYRVRIAFATPVQFEGTLERLSFGTPIAGMTTLEVFVPRPELRLVDQDRVYVEAVPDAGRGGVMLKASLASPQHRGIDLRWFAKPTAPPPVETVVHGQVSTLVVLEDRLAKISSDIAYQVVSGQLRELTLEVPSTLEVLTVTGMGIEAWSTKRDASSQTVQVRLAGPMQLSHYALRLEAEQAATEESFTMPELTLRGVRQERGQIAVVARGGLEVRADALEGVTRIDARELPDAFVGQPVVLAFRYHQHPYRGTLAITRHQELPVLGAVAERGELTTIIADQGQRLTRAVYALRANKQQFLAVRLPDGATLWSCLVAGQSVKPVESRQGGLLVPLAGTDSSTRPVTIELVYFEAGSTPSLLSRLQLESPTLDVPTTIANWIVYTPARMSLRRIAGNVGTGRAAYVFVGDSLPESPVQIAASPSASSDTYYRTIASERRAEASAFMGGAALATDFSMAKSSHSFQGLSMVRAMAVPEPSEPEPPADRQAAHDEAAQDAFVSLASRLYDQGILPLKVQLPRHGREHAFHRLVTTGESLRIEARILPAVPISWPLVRATLAIALLTGVLTLVMLVWQRRRVALLKS